jgi:hypothetical protein
VEIRCGNRRGLILKTTKSKITGKFNIEVGKFHYLMNDMGGARAVTNINVNSFPLLIDSTEAVNFTY